jgi:hypothetical protein
MTLNATIFTFSSKIEGISTNLIQVPCLHYNEPPDPTKFNKHLQEEGLVEPLKDWIQNLWSNLPNFKVLTFEAHDPLRLNASGDVIANDEYRLTLGLCEGSNSGYTGTNSIQIDYDDTLVEDLNMTFDKYDASPISSDHGHQTI